MDGVLICDQAGVTIYMYIAEALIRGAFPRILAPGVSSWYLLSSSSGFPNLAC